jgi:tetratricopeptide (TPR) repeat protein
MRADLFLLLTVMAGVSTAACAEQTWTEVRSPNFRVLTDSSAGDGRRVANEFEQMRHVFVMRFGNGGEVQSGPPLTIVAARDEATFRQVLPRQAKKSENIAGEFYSGWEKQFAIVRMDSWTGQGQVVVYHEYAHSFMHANIRWMPVWLDEGMAEFYAYTQFQHDRVLVGAPSLRSRALNTMVLLPVATMMAQRSSYDKDLKKMNEFYAEAWAMVHFMTFGPGMGNGQKLGQFVKLLQQDVPQPKAFEQVFGDQKAFDKALYEYVHRFSFSAGVFPPDKDNDPKSYTERKLSAAETAYELGCFHVGTHDREGGRALLERALALDPKIAGVHEELGYLDFDAGEDQAAAEEWTKAVALDPSLPQSLFALAMSGTPVSQQTPEQLRDTQAKLQHVTELAPKFAPAFAELALVEWRLNSMQKAYKDARQAETLEPHRAGYRLLTGHILLHGNQPALAATYARFVAQHWTGTDHNEAVELWQKIPSARRDSDPPPVADMPADAQIVRGTLTEVACRKEKGERTTFTVRPETAEGANLTTPQLLKLTGASQFRFGFSDTLWWGEDHFSLCHHVEGKTVVVAYKADTQEVEAIEIRDDLPDDSAAVRKTEKAAAGSQ